MESSARSRSSFWGRWINHVWWICAPPLRHITFLFCTPKHLYTIGTQNTITRRNNGQHTNKNNRMYAYRVAYDRVCSAANLREMRTQHRPRRMPNIPDYQRSQKSVCGAVKCYADTKKNADLCGNICRDFVWDDVCLLPFSLSPLRCFGSSAYLWNAGVHRTDTERA